jgi:hypothetical protein
MDTSATHVGAALQLQHLGSGSWQPLGIFFLGSSALLEQVQRF